MHDNLFSGDRHLLVPSSPIRRSVEVAHRDGRTVMILHTEPTPNPERVLPVALGRRRP